MPERMFSSVDLPQPDGPTTLTNSWPDTSKDAFSSATTERVVGDELLAEVLDR